MPAIMSRPPSRALVSLSLAAVLGASLLAQQRQTLTAEDYARAERFLAATVTPLVVGGSVTATWLADDRFWYRNTIAAGAEFILVDPVKKTRVRAFDHEKVAAALSSATGAKHEPFALAIQGLVPSADGAAVAFNLAGRRWSCDTQGAKCAETGAAIGEAAEPPAGGRGGRGGGRGGAAGRTSSDGKPLNMSPDGKRGVFIRDWNLWVHDVATRQERQLTTDGVKYFGYATDNAGWTSSDRAIALWSPDSKKVATQQQDEREVGELYFVNTVPWAPDAAGIEVSPARRQGHGDDPSRHHRRRLGTDRAAADAARLPSRHAQRQHQRPRLQLEPGRVAAGARLGLARSQGGLAARRRQHDRRSPHGSRREGGDTLRITHGMAGPVAQPTRSSGTRSATTGATSISTTSRPAPSSARSPLARARSRRSSASTRRRARSGTAPTDANVGAIPTTPATTASPSTDRPPAAPSR